MRKHIYTVVHEYDSTVISKIYKYFMMLVIIASIVPTMFKEDFPCFYIMDCVCLGIFLVDFALRWFTADYKLGERGYRPFLRFPLRLISVIDILSMFALVTSVFHLFDNSDIATALTVFRIVRICRYSKNIRFILEILKKSKKPLAAVGGLAVGYIVISAIIMFNVEPESFNTFFDAIYWSTVSLTTVGYGDIYPITAVGRAVAMVSSFFGIAVVALPAGIVTAEYLNIIKEDIEK